MLSTLLIIAIVASTFLTGILFDPLFPVIAETREAKAFICWMICLAVGYFGFRNFEIKKKNRWVTLFVFYTIATISMHPAFHLNVYGVNLSGFWIAPVIVQMLGYYLMFLVVANAELDLNRIFKAIFYSGFFCACYVLIQALNFDQLFVLMPHEVVLGTPQPHLTSFLGQKTIAAAFIAMTIPFGFCFKRYFFMLIMSAAVILTMCKMAIASLVLGAVLYVILTVRNHGAVVVVIIGALTLCACTGFLFLDHKIHVQDNGRFGLWRDVLTDFRSPQVVDDVPRDAAPDVKTAIEMGNQHTWVLTGVGPGAYPFVFVNKHESAWKHIHNEYIEVLYGWGVIGMVIFLMGWISVFFRGLWNCNSVAKSVLLTSLLIISINAATNFVWQVDPTRFLTVLITGLLCA